MSSRTTDGDDPRSMTFVPSTLTSLPFNSWSISSSNHLWPVSLNYQRPALFSNHRFNIPAAQTGLPFNSWSVLDDPSKEPMPLCQFIPFVAVKAVGGVEDDASMLASKSGDLIACSPSPNGDKLPSFITATPLLRKASAVTSLTSSVSQRQQKRRALLIACSYADAPAVKHVLPPLPYSVRDVVKLKDFLIDTCGWEKQDITVLSEDGPYAALDSYPTRANILECMSKLTGNAQAGDFFIFFFSGHGLVQFEDDENAEAILPSDHWKIKEQITAEHTTSGLSGTPSLHDAVISDDDLRKALLEPLPAGVTLCCLIDTCHSGTMLDLPFLEHTAVTPRLNALGHPLSMRQTDISEKEKGFKFDNNNAKEPSKNFHNASLIHGLPLHEGTDLETPALTSDPARHNSDIPGTVVCFSSCPDDRYSCIIEQSEGSSLVKAFCEALQNGVGHTVFDLYEQLCRFLSMTSAPMLSHSFQSVSVMCKTHSQLRQRGRGINKPFGE